MGKIGVLLAKAERRTTKVNCLVILLIFFLCTLTALIATVICLSLTLDKRIVEGHTRSGKNRPRRSLNGSEELGAEVLIRNRRELVVTSGSQTKTIIYEFTSQDFEQRWAQMPLSKEELEIVMRAIKDVMEEVELDVTDKGVKLPRGPLPEYIKCADVRNCWIGDKLNQTVLWCQKPKGLRAGAVVLKSWGNCMNMSQLENCPYWNPQDGLVRIIEESGRRMKGKRSVEGTDGPGSTQRGTPLGGSLATRYPTATDSPSGNKEGNGSFHGTMINGTNPMTKSSAAPSGPPGFPTSTFSSPMPTTDTTSRIRYTVPTALTTEWMVCSGKLNDTRPGVSYVWIGRSVGGSNNEWHYLRLITWAYPECRENNLEGIQVVSPATIQSLGQNYTVKARSYRDYRRIRGYQETPLDEFGYQAYGIAFAQRLEQYLRGIRKVLAGKYPKQYFAENIEEYLFIAENIYQEHKQKQLATAKVIGGRRMEHGYEIVIQVTIPQIEKYYEESFDVINYGILEPVDGGYKKTKREFNFDLVAINFNGITHWEKSQCKETVKMIICPEQAKRRPCYLSDSCNERVTYLVASVGIHQLPSGKYLVQDTGLCFNQTLSPIILPVMEEKQCEGITLHPNFDLEQTGTEVYTFGEGVTHTYGVIIDWLIGSSRDVTIRGRRSPAVAEEMAQIVQQGDYWYWGFMKEQFEMLANQSYNFRDQYDKIINHPSSVNLYTHRIFYKAEVYCMSKMRAMAFKKNQTGKWEFNPKRFYGPKVPSDAARPLGILTCHPSTMMYLRYVSDVKKNQAIGNILTYPQWMRVCSQVLFEHWSIIGKDNFKQFLEIWVKVIMNRKSVAMGHWRRLLEAAVNESDFSTDGRLGPSWYCLNSSVATIIRGQIEEIRDKTGWRVQVNNQSNYAPDKNAFTDFLGNYIVNPVFSRLSNPGLLLKDLANTGGVLGEGVAQIAKTTLTGILTPFSGLMGTIGEIGFWILVIFGVIIGLVLLTGLIRVLILVAKITRVNRKGKYRRLDTPRELQAEHVTELRELKRGGENCRAH